MFEMHPKAAPEYTVSGDKWRFTVLTDRMLRLEYSEDGYFEDRATRLAFNRAFDTPEFEYYEQDGLLHIKTKHLHLTYDKRPFSELGLQITVDTTKPWLYGQTPMALPSTVKTLDGVNGSIPLGRSFLNRKTGIGVIDDSKTLCINEDGWPEPSRQGRTDVYFFGYPGDYESAIRDFYKLSAPIPLIPRYAFGNWWSRYHKYSDVEYVELMDKFKEKGLPFSVAVIDMDWHITQTPDPVRFGGGWTGYTWNESLFPDHVGFLAALHQRGLATSLNLHPRDGIRAYEERYPDIARELGKDIEKGDQIEFDVSSREFMDAYFKTVLDPMEDEGVDFWWIDWQQSGGSRKAGYDPLWMLNHCHYTDNARNGKRPLLFSRFAEIGSHRYPLGFSGDTHITWESLDFQPYFTSCASNIGFSMWSHDIGGHYHGVHDPELYTRWLQLGVFSPINRLHSSPSPFISKEPWNFGAEAEKIAGEFLRLRHKLIPYIYTEHTKNHTDGIPLIRPMYHKYPHSSAAYDIKNEYLFGSELIVCPVTTKRDAESHLSKTKVWLPEGSWIDFFSGHVYSGNRIIDVYRDLESMPVFAKAGAIIPLADVAEGDNSTQNPSKIALRVFGGDDGEYTLVEDNDAIGENNATSKTRFALSYGTITNLEICSADECEHIPSLRTYSVCFEAFTAPEAVTVSVKGITIPLSFTYDEKAKRILCAPISLEAGSYAVITVLSGGVLPENEISDCVTKAIMNGAGLAIEDSRSLLAITQKHTSLHSRVSEILSHSGNEYLKGYICELLCAK